MAEYLRHYLHYTFHSLTKYDVMALGWVLFLAFLLMILGAFVRRKSLSYFLLLIGLSLLFAGPPAIKIAMDHYLRAAKVTVTNVKPLHYSHALLIEGDLTNEGRSDFSACDLVASIDTHTSKKGFASLWNPERVFIQRIPGPIVKGETKPFRIIVDRFRSDGDVNASVTARCYP